MFNWIKLILKTKSKSNKITIVELNSTNIKNNEKSVLIE